MKVMADLLACLEGKFSTELGINVAQGPAAAAPWKSKDFAKSLGFMLGVF